MAYICQTINIITFRDGSEVVTPIRKVVLENSPVFQRWIRSPDTAPDGMDRDDWRFPAVDPEVMRALVRHLENFNAPVCFDVPVERYSALLIGLFNLALSAAVQRLADQAFVMLTKPQYSVNAFLEIIVLADQAKLLENKWFRTWAVAYFARIRHEFQAAGNVGLRQAVAGGGESTWLLCSALVSIVADLAAEHGYSGGQAEISALLTPEASPNRRA